MGMASKRKGKRVTVAGQRLACVKRLLELVKMTMLGSPHRNVLIPAAMLGHVSWLMVPSVAQAPAAIPTVSLSHTAPPAEQPVGSVILKSTVWETVKSAQ